MNKKLPCVCGHRNDKHTKTNNKVYDRLREQMKGYKERSLKDRERFWRKFLSGIRLEEFGCSRCTCDSFKQDNLKYLEDIYEVKKV